MSIRHFGMFVQIEPGIDAIVWPRDVPLLPNQLLTDVLNLGDQVQGIVTKFDLQKKDLQISLTDWLRNLSALTTEKRSPLQLSLFDTNLSEGDDTNVKNSESQAERKKTQKLRYHQPLSKLEQILVIDNEEIQLNRICPAIQECFKESVKGDPLYTEAEVQVKGVSSSTEALEALKESTYNLAIVDFMLGKETGLEVAEKLLKAQSDLAIIFASSDPTIEDELVSIGDLKYPFTVKNPEDIIDWIEKIQGGYWEDVSASEAATYTGIGSFIRQLGMTAFSKQSLSDALSTMLAELRRQTQVSQCLVLEIDSENESVSVLGSDPPLEENIIQVSLDGLYYSPVRNVVEYEEEFYVTDVIQSRDKRFDYFFPKLSFRLCLGIPLTIPDLVTRHALFMLDEGRTKLRAGELNLARMTSLLLQAALERALLLDYMRRYEVRYSQGQLVGSLVHEFTNKLDAMDMQTLPVALKRAQNATDDSERKRNIDVAIEIAEDLTTSKEELKELVNAYSRLTIGDFETVDPNEVVQRVKRQLETKAKELSSEIFLDLQAEIPQIKAISSRLEQIVLNVVLNSIQQIDHQRKLMARIARERNEDFVLLPRGQVIIQTIYDESFAPYPIRIIVTDTGPGIHYRMQDKLFKVDTTTRRKGHGLGLFISRNLAETMGGQIRLLDSIMFVGSVFAVEFPRA